MRTSRRGRQAGPQIQRLNQKLSYIQATDNKAKEIATTTYLKTGRRYTGKLYLSVNGVVAFIWTDYESEFTRKT
jgi:hypothetical protein